MSGNARGWSWPPFEVGNTASMRSGAWSERKIAPLADAIAAELVETSPHLGAPAFVGAVRALARAEARLQLLLDWFDDVGPVDADGELRKGWTTVDRLERTAAGLRSELALTPRSLAAFAADASRGRLPAAEDARAALSAAGRALVERQQQLPPSTNEGTPDEHHEP
jgi:hypothetical protein